MHRGLLTPLHPLATRGGGRAGGIAGTEDLSVSASVCVLKKINCGDQESALKGSRGVFLGFIFRVADVT